MLDIINQAAAFVFGAGAILLVARKNKWGFVLGLVSQPFWLMTSYLNEQWGIFFLSIVYAGIWIYGIYEWFWRNKKMVMQQEESLS